MSLRQITPKSEGNPQAWLQDVGGELLTAPTDGCAYCFARVPAQWATRHNEEGLPGVRAGYHCPPCGHYWWTAWGGAWLEPQQGEDVGLVRCQKCGAPDHWVSIYDDELGTWDCRCDRCGHEWTQAS